MVERGCVVSELPEKRAKRRKECEKSGKSKEMSHKKADSEQKSTRNKV